MTKRNPNPPFVVDGHEYANPESNLVGDGQSPPFRIFDTERQDYLPGVYQTRAEAEAIVALGPKPQTVVQGHAPNLQTIIKAAKNGDLALMECKRVSDGKIVAVVCCVGREKGEYVMAPMAEMFEENPYEQWLPPEVVDAGGTVHPVKDAVRSVIQLAETWISERESPPGSWVEDHAAIALLKKTFELEEKSNG